MLLLRVLARRSAYARRNPERTMRHIVKQANAIGMKFRPACRSCRPRRAACHRGPAMRRRKRRRRYRVGPRRTEFAARVGSEGRTIARVSDGEAELGCCASQLIRAEVRQQCCDECGGAADRRRNRRVLVEIGQDVGRVPEIVRRVGYT